MTKNINIMWNALSKNRMFDGNKELKEFMKDASTFANLGFLDTIGV